VPSISPFSVPNSSSSYSSTSAPRSRRSEQRVSGGKLWRQVATPSNTYRNSKVSRAWEHGAEYLDINQPHNPHRWICDYCDAFITLNNDRITANAARHLRAKHNLVLKRRQSEMEEEEEPRQINKEEQEGRRRRRRRRSLYHRNQGNSQSSRHGVRSLISRL
jgi:hypothetical protein